MLSQSCDLVKGRENVQQVLVCALWRLSDLTSGHLSTPKGLEDARRGNLPGFHMLAESDVQDFEREVRIVDFHYIWTLPVEYLRRRLAQAIHLCLLSPYREHLSQAFARYFMRVGLPLDIPNFK